MASSLAIGVAALKARTKKIRATAHGATVVCASRDEAETMRNNAYDLGRSDIKYTTQSQIDWEAGAPERQRALEQKIAEARVKRVADETHADGSMVEASHPLKELEATW